MNLDQFIEFLIEEGEINKDVIEKSLEVDEFPLARKILLKIEGQTTLLENILRPKNEGELLIAKGELLRICILNDQDVKQQGIKFIDYLIKKVREKFNLYPSEKKVVKNKNSNPLISNENENYQELNKKNYKKFKRRALDSVRRNLFPKASKQVSTLVKFLSDKVDEEYLDIKALSYALKLRELIAPAYNRTNGETLIDIQSKAANAEIYSPQWEFVRFDLTMVDLIDEIENICDSLGRKKSIFFARKSWNYIYETLHEFIIPATEYIASNASYTNHIESYPGLRDRTVKKALAQPVYIAIQLRCQMYSMLMKFLEIIDIDNPEISLQIRQESIDNCFCDFSLNSLDLDKRHPKEPYNYEQIMQNADVSEAVERWHNLNKRLEPLLKEKERIEKEKQERLKKQRESEDLQKAQAKKEATEKFLASPEYLAFKKRQKKLIIRCWIITILGFGIPIIGEFVKKNYFQNSENLPSISTEK